MLGAFGGFALGIFVYPYRVPLRHRHREGAGEAGGEARKVLARGTFIHANPSDPIHYGKGGVTVYEGVLHLEPDFEVGPGPKFHVYLVPEKEVVPSTNVARTMFVDLGRLGLQGQPELRHPGRDRHRQVRLGRDLVRAVRGLDFARGAVGRRHKNRARL